MKFVAVCFLAAMLVVGTTAQSVCPAVCPALWAPLCARNSEGTEASFDNECMMNAKNCAQKSDFAKVRGGAC